MLQLIYVYQFQAPLRHQINISMHVNVWVDISHRDILPLQDHITWVERALACNNARVHSTLMEDWTKKNLFRTKHSYLFSANLLK